MLVLVLAFLQLNFLLQVRRADLAQISTKELDGLTRTMATALKVITNKDYLVTGQMTLDGVMMSINT